MEPSRCEAIVLGLMDYREADRIVTLFTMEHGKLRGIARGAKRSVRRFGGALELFAHLRVQLVMREGLSTLNGVDIVSIFSGIRHDLEKIALAGYACELTDHLLPDCHANPRYFRLLVTLLEHLDRSSPSQSDRRFFEMNLLNILGYRIPLDECIFCGRTLESGGRLRWSSEHCGFSCDPCGRSGRPITGESRTLLRNCLNTGRFGAVVIPAELLVEVGIVLDSAIASHLDRPLKSLAFLREVAEGMG